MNSVYTEDGWVLVSDELLQAIAATRAMLVETLPLNGKDLDRQELQDLCAYMAATAFTDATHPFRDPSGQDSGNLPQTAIVAVYLPLSPSLPHEPRLKVRFESGFADLIQAALRPALERLLLSEPSEIELARRESNSVPESKMVEWLRWARYAEAVAAFLDIEAPEWASQITNKLETSAQRFRV